MLDKKTCNTAITDYQLVNEIIPLKNEILFEGLYFPDKLKDEFFAKIFDLAQKWDNMFKDSLGQGGIL